MSKEVIIEMVLRAINFLTLNGLESKSNYLNKPPFGQDDGSDIVETNQRAGVNADGAATQTHTDAERAAVLEKLAKIEEDVAKFR